MSQKEFGTMDMLALWIKKHVSRKQEEPTPPDVPDQEYIDVDEVIWHDFPEAIDIHNPRNKFERMVVQALMTKKPVNSKDFEVTDDAAAAEVDSD